MKFHTKYLWFNTAKHREYINITNVVNANTVTEANNMVFDTMGGEMELNITAASMAESEKGYDAANDETSLIVNFTANTPYRMVCTYDIVYEWISADRYTSHSPGGTDNEFTIGANLQLNDNVNQGINYIEEEIDLSEVVGNQTSAVVVSGAQIDALGSNTSTAVWDIYSYFINTDVDQSALSGKTFAGRFKVANVSCVRGRITQSRPTSYWFDSQIPCTARCSTSVSLLLIF